MIMTRASAFALMAVASMLLPNAACAQLPNADEIDQFVNAEMESQHIAGLALAVVKRGHVIHARGFGFADRERKIPVSPETVFKIGSVSKQFLASGIMLLVQEGRLGLDDPVSRYLKDAPRTWDAITIRHLLTHTAGIIREGPALNTMVRQPDIKVIRSAYSAPLQFD